MCKSKARSCALTESRYYLHEKHPLLGLGFKPTAFWLTSSWIAFLTGISISPIKKISPVKDPLPSRGGDKELSLPVTVLVIWKLTQTIQKRKYAIASLTALRNQNQLSGPVVFSVSSETVFSLFSVKNRSHRDLAFYDRGHFSSGSSFPGFLFSGLFRFLLKRLRTDLFVRFSRSRKSDFFFKSAFFPELMVSIISLIPCLLSLWRNARGAMV